MSAAKKNTVENTITLMPESSGKTVCFRMPHTITVEDCGKISEILGKAADEFGKLNILFYYSPDFKGWNEDAADANMKAVIDFGNRTSRIAYVNPPQKKIMQHKFAPDLFSGEIKYFTEDELQDAIDWVKQ